jgi:hypothetical protein
MIYEGGAAGGGWIGGPLRYNARLQLPPKRRLEGADPQAPGISFLLDAPSRCERRAQDIRVDVKVT